MGNDSTWVSGQTWQVPVATGDIVKQYCVGGASTPELKTKVKQYLATRELTNGVEEEEVSRL